MLELENPGNGLLCKYYGYCCPVWDFFSFKSLTYFVDSENDIMPEMLMEKSWEQVKKEITGKQSQAG
ncbi:MAG: hypothetical protein LBB36_03705 [Fibromonadaceae bacterium]|jgi:hypothetical protein|nr:hypothetical protein [Fibromonadaceae bacterium]